MDLSVKLGATYLGNSRCQFCLWAPLAEHVKLHVLSPVEMMLPLERSHRGYFAGTFDNIVPGSLYLYALDNNAEYPDPASRFQPRGVHGPSQVVDQSFEWEDTAWRGIPLEEYILYEVHTGTFTPDGTFEAIIDRLDRLKDLGITALELMPVAQFPGSRNWGYDGVYPFAVQDSYGGILGLKKLVNACHLRGLAVVLDVVYNHFGPEGNYSACFGPYFTHRYQTPWGAAINFDGPESDEVRRFFIENAFYWLEYFHLDALRIDALHGIVDQSAQPFLQELARRFHEKTKQLKRLTVIFAESDLNDNRVLRSPDLGGYGFDAQWNDDFHHAIHALLTGERCGYYGDFGEMGQLIKAFREGFVYSGEYSQFRHRSHGNSSHGIPAERFVVAIQNHDQVGNRILGERLGRLVSFDSLKLAAGLVLLSPFIPLLFMGEEWGEEAPFLYFISHSDPDLVQAVRRGRQAEFARFSWTDESVDPQDEATFLRCKINPELRKRRGHHGLYSFYRELIRLRQQTPALARLDKNTLEARQYDNSQLLYLRRWVPGEEYALLFNIGDNTAGLPFPLSPGTWSKVLDSSDERWDGSGSCVADAVESDGTAPLDIPPKTVIVFQHKG